MALGVVGLRCWVRFNMKCVGVCEARLKCVSVRCWLMRWDVCRKFAPLSFISLCHSLSPSVLGFGLFQGCTKHVIVCFWIRFLGQVCAALSLSLLKREFTKKWQFCHHLLTSCYSKSISHSFFPLWNTKYIFFSIQRIESMGSIVVLDPHEDVG